MEIKGKIKKIFETQTFQSGFQKREMVVTTQEQYPQDILIEFLQDKVVLLDAYKVGDDVKVHINLRGKEWVNPEGVAKYFNSINGWRIERESAAPVAPVAPTVEESLTEEGDDDLPF